MPSPYTERLRRDSRVLPYGGGPSLSLLMIGGAIVAIVWTLLNWNEIDANWDEIDDNWDGV